MCIRDSDNSIIPINLDNIKLYFRDNQDLYFTNIEKPIIVDVKIVDILDSTTTYGKIEGIISVSYTHLDVYKRQIVGMLMKSF